MTEIISLANERDKAKLSLELDQDLHAIKLLADLAVHIETCGEPISEAGSPLWPVLVDLQARVTRLWARVTGEV